MSEPKQLFSASLARDAVLDCSDDLEILEIYSPAVHETIAVEAMLAAAAAR